MIRAASSQPFEIITTHPGSGGMRKRRRRAVASLAVALTQAGRAECNGDPELSDNSIPHGEVVFVCEGRIGDVPTGHNRGEFEVLIGPSTAAPHQGKDFDWVSGQTFAFIAQYDPEMLDAQGRRFVSFAVGQTEVRYPLPEDVFKKATAEGTELWLRARAVKGNSTVSLTDLALSVAGEAVTLDQACLESAGPNDLDLVRIVGQALPAGFVLTGNATLAWNGNNVPARSQLAFQIKFTEKTRVESVAFEPVVKPLDENPNEGGGQRIFAERDDPGAEPSQDNQTVKVKATVFPRRAGVTVFFRSFDVDDPSADACPVDCNDQNNPGAGNDNRGSVELGGVPNTGVFVGFDTQPGSGQAQTGATGEAVLDLIVTMQPGDNFRVAAALEADMLDDLTVNPLDLQTDPELLYVPAGNDAGLDGFDGKLTQMLTVWRTLHVELDSMEPVPAPPHPQQNIKSGKVVEIRGASPEAKEITVDMDLRDGSPDMDDDEVPLGFGRFELGELTIGTGAGVPGATVTPNICCNGRFIVQKGFDGGIEIAFLMTKPGLPPVTGRVWQWDAGSLEFHVAVTEGTLATQYKDGTLNISGVEMEIRRVRVNHGIVQVKTLKEIPFVLHDDDDDTVLPKIPDTSLLADALAEAYLVFDLVGTQDVDLPFVANVHPSAAVTLHAPWQTRTSNSADYWVAYVIAGFQGRTYAEPAPGFVVADGDPNIELAIGPIFGVTTAPTGGSIIFLETIRDLQLHINTIPGLSELYESLGIELEIMEADTLIHEVGHAISQQGLHVPNTGTGVTNGSGRYLPEYLDLIRLSTKPFP
jgi:hypothetical protein